MAEVTILGWRDALLGFRDKKDGIFNIFTVSSRLSFISLFLPSLSLAYSHCVCGAGCMVLSSVRRHCVRMMCVGTD